MVFSVGTGLVHDALIPLRVDRLLVVLLVGAVALAIAWTVLSLGGALEPAVPIATEDGSAWADLVPTRLANAVTPRAA